jgi:hypothetical protein
MKDGASYQPAPALPTKCQFQTESLPIGELSVLYVEISRYEALKWFPQGGVFAEVGVFKGDFSRKIIDAVAPKRLHLIDVWKWTYYDWDKPPASELKNIAQNRSIPNMTAAIPIGCLNASTRI